jgi:hypothetical protein
MSIKNFKKFINESKIEIGKDYLYLGREECEVIELLGVVNGENIFKAIDKNGTILIAFSHMLTPLKNKEIKDKPNRVRWYNKGKLE